jgi:arylsulfatase A-like enzyme
MSQHTNIDPGPETPKANDLFAGFIGLFVILVISRFLVLRWTPGRYYLPISIYQDVAFWSVLAWCFYGLLKLWPESLLVLLAGWVVCLLTAVFTTLDFIIYTNIRSPLTYGLWLTADQGRGIEVSVSRAVSAGEVMVPLAVFTMIIVAESLSRLAPKTVRRIRTGFHSPAVAIAICLYVLGAHLWTVTYRQHMTVAANFEWALASSLLRSTPRVLDVIPAGYTSDFLPQGRRKAAGYSQSPSRVSTSFQPSSSQRPINVLMIVMESVGARRLQLYGAPHQDSPELVRLARHGMVFDRVYAAEAYTSAAMPGLFCSLYPEHGWLNLLRLFPDIRVPGLANVLAGHGYRTAFMHEGQLIFDNQSAFVESHGFQEVFFRDHDPDVAGDSALLPIVEKWIKSDPDKPFFLAIWTQDTHHPYLPTSDDDYHTGDRQLNRYLNAVHSTDALIAQLVHSLDEMKIADNTIVVITGDHGEAFGDHGQIGHGFTVYDEEVHIPLVFLNPRMFPAESRIESIGRQIDIAPTLLGLLGYDAPESWQGTNLLGDYPPERAYMFASSGNSFLGLVEGNFKYIHDFDHDRDELYDLVHDPGEVRNLSSALQNRSLVARDHLRVEAWLSFQDKYLATLGRAQDGRTSVEHKIE